MAKLHFPIVIDSTCEGEDCEATDFPAVACEAAVVRGSASDSSAVVAHIRVGDTVRVIARSLHLLQPGIVLVRRDYTLANYSQDEGPVPRKDTLHFVARDTLYLLRYLELGVWAWSYKGVLQDGDEFWGTTIPMNLGRMSEDTTNAVLRSAPLIAHWWQVQPKRGPAGWWHEEAGPALESVNHHLKWSENCPVRKA